MATGNSLQTTVKNNGSFSAFCASPAIKHRISEMMSGEEGTRFIGSLVAAVSQNPALQKCDPSTIITAAFTGQSLKLPFNNSLGFYYIVPFEDNKNHRTVGQFQIGYRGLIQLAIRSGFYKRLNVCELREGELKSFNPLSEEITVEMEQDEAKRNKLTVTHYYASFEYNNGFKKVLVWSKSKMEEHARTYSKAYKRDLAQNTAYSFWAKNFDAMAFKTMLRQLLGKWGILSVDLQKAMETDFADGTNTETDMPDVLPAEVVGESATEAKDVKEEIAKPEAKKKPAKKEEVKTQEAPAEIINTDEDMEAAFFD